MESKVKVLGHAGRPILIVFLLGLLIMILIFDVLYFVTDNGAFATGRLLRHRSWNHRRALI
jgi:uncharacterized membrane protein